MSVDREELKHLVDEVPESELEAAKRYLEFLRDVDPIRRALDAAPLDDEPLTDEEREAVEEAESDIRAGRTMSMDEFKREFDL